MNDGFLNRRFAGGWIATLLLAAFIPAGAFAQESTTAPKQSRQRTEAPADPAVRTAVGEDLEFVQDVVYATIERENAEPIQLTMNVMFKKNNGDQIMPVVIYIHGGGYAMGSKDDGNALLPALARGGYFAATISYRLSGVAPWPAAAHDCKAAVRFIRANAEELGIDPQRIGVWGHSAGGHLSALLAVSGNAPELDGKIGTTGVSSAVQCAVDISGPTDFLKFDRNGPVFSGIIQSFFAGPDDTLDDRMKAASTITYVDAGDPPTMIVHGTDDNLVPIEQSNILSDAFEKAGVEHEYKKVEGDGHIVAARDAYIAIAEFFDKHLGGQSAEVVRRASSIEQQADDENRPRRQREGDQPQRPRRPTPDAPQ